MCGCDAGRYCDGRPGLQSGTDAGACAGQSTSARRSAMIEAPPGPQTDQQVTLVGCVARDGATDVILTSAMPASASGNVSGGVTGSTSTGITGTSGTAAGSATGTSGAVTSRYRLSGERDLERIHRPARRGRRPDGSEREHQRRQCADRRRCNAELRRCRPEPAPARARRRAAALPLLCRR